jgi:hypothetical protein
VNTKPYKMSDMCEHRERLKAYLHESKRGLIVTALSTSSANVIAPGRSCICNCVVWSRLLMKSVTFRGRDMENQRIGVENASLGTEPVRGNEPSMETIRAKLGSNVMTFNLIVKTNPKRSLHVANEKEAIDPTHTMRICEGQVVKYNIDIFNEKHSRLDNIRNSAHTATPK